MYREFRQEATEAALATAPSRLRMLVAIASYGSKNLALLHEMIRRLREFEMHVDIVVLSNEPKALGPGVEVVVGLPSPNPWSLPFAHKALFAQRAADYDLFLYTEDDIGITQAHVEAFLRVTPELADDEIAGFMRYEVDAAGTRYLLDVHGRFHWKPESARRRGDFVVAEYTNEHAAMYLLTRRQLERALVSGGFLRPPCEDQHDMLCTAATDPYTVCGFRKVLCISQLDDFLVHHMSNRYAGRWGLTRAEVGEQLRTQIEIAAGRHPASTLCPTETRLMHGEWSKSYHELPSDEVLALVPAHARSVLSIGCGWGAAERRLQARGASLTVVPLDSVVGADAHRAGMEVVYGTLDECRVALGGRRFDALLMTNLLHLLPDPAQAVAAWAPLVAPDGVFVLSGPNLGALRVRAKEMLGRGGYRKLRAYGASGMHRLGPAAVEHQLAAAGLRRCARHWIASAGAGRLESRLGPLGAASWAIQARH